jgi:hypothetical protein
MIAASGWDCAFQARRGGSQPGWEVDCADRKALPTHKHLHQQIQKSVDLLSGFMMKSGGGEAESDHLDLLTPAMRARGQSVVARR